MIFLSICRGKFHDTSLLEVFSALNQTLTELPAVTASDAIVKVNVPSRPQAYDARPSKKTTHAHGRNFRWRRIFMIKIFRRPQETPAFRRRANIAGRVRSDNFESN
jgi:hypothetical protein